MQLHLSLCPLPPPWQVLVSIQSQILVDDPMTNEPLSETMAGTSEGAAKTAEYNARLQVGRRRHTRGWWAGGLWQDVAA